jgi:hypothetical protein
MMSPLAKITWLIILNAGVWSFNALVYKGTIKLSAKAGIPVTLEIDPARARLTVNAKLWEDRGAINGWIQSPAILHLPPGQHRLMLERPGYAPHIFKVLINPDDKITMKTMLEAKSERFIELELFGEDVSDLTAVIDQGLEFGTLPLRVDDILPGKHQLELRFHGIDALRYKPFICQFLIAANSDRLVKIQVVRHGKKIRVPGCKRI